MGSVKVYTTDTLQAKQDKARLHQYQCALLLGTARKLRATGCPKCARKEEHHQH